MAPHPRLWIGWPRRTGITRHIAGPRMKAVTAPLGTTAGPHSSRMYWSPNLARVTEFSIGCSKTINLGNYQSLRVEASVTVSVDANESLADVSDLAQEELRRLLEETYQAQYKHAQSLL